MNNTVPAIPLLNLSLAFLPVLAVIGILFKWSRVGKNSLYAVARMLAQLLLIGYFLAFIFASDRAWVVVLILCSMVASSSWIALGAIKPRRRRLFRYAFGAILLGGGTTLALITQGVLGLVPWYRPRFMIPLAGMIFANAMNSVSLSAERLHAELTRGVEYEAARRIALAAGLIPITNSLFAVGLVSVPGMMTGQILSGVSPLIAARYQIMVMCMVFGAAGLASAAFLAVARPAFQPPGPETRRGRNEGDAG